jgi:uncharacterized BrkB/YihY/UPF0761 family membrane protein
LFPLLLVITTIIGIITTNNPQAQATATNAIAKYIPAIGDQLYGHIHSINKNGLALLLAILFTVYGARGAVESFVDSTKNIWGEAVKKENLIVKAIRSISVLAVGVLGLGIASVATGYIASTSHGIIAKSISFLFNILALYWIFIIILKISIDKKIRFKKIRPGSMFAAISLVILQTIGGVILTRQLQTLDTLYSVFALPLGLMFWIYLQAQVIYLAVVGSVVNQKKLWPRAINGNNPTTAELKN